MHIHARSKVKQSTVAPRAVSQRTSSLNSVFERFLERMLEQSPCKCNAWAADAEPSVANAASLPQILRLLCSGCSRCGACAADAAPVQQMQCLCSRCSACGADTVSVLQI